MSPTEFQDHVSWIDGRIRVALHHYYQPDRDQHLVDAALRDWIDCLEEFSRDLIDQVVARYLRTEARRRPTPADIRKRCEAEVGVAHSRARSHKTEPKPDTRTPVSDEAARRIMDEVYQTSERTRR